MIALKDKRFASDNQSFDYSLYTGDENVAFWKQELTGQRVRYTCI